MPTSSDGQCDISQRSQMDSASSPKCRLLGQCTPTTNVGSWYSQRKLGKWFNDIVTALLEDTFTLKKLILFFTSLAQLFEVGNGDILKKSAVKR